MSTLVTWNYYDLWEEKLTFIYLILGHFGSIYSIYNNIPIDVIKYICIIYLKNEICNIPHQFKCPCNDQKCQIEWFRLDIHPSKRDGRFKDTVIWFKEIHCSTKNCHVIYEPLNYIKCWCCEGVFCQECEGEGERSDRGEDMFTCYDCMWNDDSDQCLK